MANLITVEFLLSQGLSQEQAEKIAQAAKPTPKGLTLKVQREPRVNKETGDIKPPSGAISLYGLGQFPVTLYKSQWERLLEQAETIKAFLQDPANQQGMSQGK